MSKSVNRLSDFVKPGAKLLRTILFHNNCLRQCNTETKLFLHTFPTKMRDAFSYFHVWILWVFRNSKLYKQFAPLTAVQKLFHLSWFKKSITWPKSNKQSFGKAASKTQILKSLRDQVKTIDVGTSIKDICQSNWPEKTVELVFETSFVLLHIKHAHNSRQKAHSSGLQLKPVEVNEKFPSPLCDSWGKGQCRTYKILPLQLQYQRKVCTKKNPIDDLITECLLGYQTMKTE